MSMTEILEELSILKPEERQVILQRLGELEAREMEETPEMLTALDEGIRSIERHGAIPIEEVQARMEMKWRTE